jgi:hypothetical protein
VRKAFEKSAILNEVFTFRSDFARRRDLDLSWQKEEFELVTVFTLASMDEREVSVVMPSSGSSSNVGLVARTNNDVLKWLSKNAERYAFCFPPESTGPDLFFFFIRSNTTRRLLLVALQAKHYKNIDNSTLVQGERTITPTLLLEERRVCRLGSLLEII